MRVRLLVRAQDCARWLVPMSWRRRRPLRYPPETAGWVCNLRYTQMQAPVRELAVITDVKHGHATTYGAVGCGDAYCTRLGMLSVVCGLI